MLMPQRRQRRSAMRAAPRFHSVHLRGRDAALPPRSSMGLLRVHARHGERDAGPDAAGFEEVNLTEPDDPHELSPFVQECAWNRRVSYARAEPHTKETKHECRIQDLRMPYRRLPLQSVPLRRLPLRVLRLRLRLAARGAAAAEGPTYTNGGSRARPVPDFRPDGKSYSTGGACAPGT